MGPLPWLAARFSGKRLFFSLEEGKRKSALLSRALREKLRSRNVLDFLGAGEVHFLFGAEGFEELESRSLFSR